jgi:hypothetical protein
MATRWASTRPSPKAAFSTAFAVLAARIRAGHSARPRARASSLTPPSSGGCAVRRSSCSARFARDVSVRACSALRAPSARRWTKSAAIFPVARSAPSARCAFARALSAVRASAAAQTVVAFSALSATCCLCQRLRPARSARPRSRVVSLTPSDPERAPISGTAPSVGTDSRTEAYRRLRKSQSPSGSERRIARPSTPTD